jgi:hypothetical protein
MAIEKPSALQEEVHSLLQFLERSTEQRLSGDPDQIFACRDLIQKRVYTCPHQPFCPVTAHCSTQATPCRNANPHVLQFILKHN